jgi:hypothetical protein
MTSHSAETDGPAEVDAFFAISALLTGYTRAELHATGCGEEYWQQFRQVTPARILREFLSHRPALEKALSKDPKTVASDVRRIYMSSDRLGPLARSLIQLWYLGQWVPLPQNWCRTFGVSRFNVSMIISTRTYKEGLVWDAIGAHPMGAKQQGFGAWAAEPPRRRG